ncbi:uncharacterized protein [Nicotiana tomentosiformis]|uniref:uncharacterized protein n=1 Tax=Nicotiana tomentosiformis TaxID=4098 RepID=UPI00388C51EE
MPMILETIHPSPREDGDEEEENEGPDLTREYAPLPVDQESLPKYMDALQYFNPEMVVEWKLERSSGKPEYIFNYVFWAFKPAIDGFPHCRPVISIDNTHVYEKYDIKLLIAIAVDANGQIFPLVFAICANESQEMWTLSVENLPAWQEPYAYHRYCVRHFKANFQKAHPKKDLHDLMWMAITDHQEHKFRRHMKSIRKEDERAYHWLMRYVLHKWTLHTDGGRRWEILTTNVSESFNELLKSSRGLSVTAMVRMSFKQMAERILERAAAETSLMEMGVEFMPLPMKRFEKCRRRAHWHSFL